MAFISLPSPADSAERLRSPLTILVGHAAGRPIVVALRGEADLSSRRALSGVLCQVIAWRSGGVIIDLLEATFIDTATARLLATAQQLLDRQGRDLIFRSPSRLAAEMLARFGLTDLVEEATHEHDTSGYDTYGHVPRPAPSEIRTNQLGPGPRPGA